MERPGSPAFRRESGFFTSAHVPRYAVVRGREEAAPVMFALSSPGLASLYQASPALSPLVVSPQDSLYTEVVGRSPPLRPMSPRLPGKRFVQSRSPVHAAAASALSNPQRNTVSLKALDGSVRLAPSRAARVCESSTKVVARRITPAMEARTEASSFAGGLIPSIKSLFGFSSAAESPGSQADAVAWKRAGTSAVRAAQQVAQEGRESRRVSRRSFALQQHGPTGERTAMHPEMSALSRGTLAFSQLVQQANSPSGSQLPCLLTDKRVGPAVEKGSRLPTKGPRGGPVCVDAAGNLWEMSRVGGPGRATPAHGGQSAGQQTAAQSPSAESGVANGKTGNHAPGVAGATAAPSAAHRASPAGVVAQEQKQSPSGARGSRRVSQENETGEGVKGEAAGVRGLSGLAANPPNGVAGAGNGRGPEGGARQDAGPMLYEDNHVLLQFGQSYPEGVLTGCKKVVEFNPETSQVKERVVHKLMIHESPDVFVLPDLLSPASCDKVISICEGRWERSKTSRGPMHALSESYSSGDSLSRTSMSVRLSPGETPEVERLESIVAAFAEMPVSHLEPLVVVKYEEGEFFREHHDGQFRRTTILLYLNDVAEGGETEFPHLGLKLSPVKGSGVMWRNVFETTNQIDPRVLHAALPPVAGRKYVVNCFFNERPVRVASAPKAVPANGNPQQLHRSEKGVAASLSGLPRPLTPAASLDPRLARPHLVPSGAAPLASHSGQSSNVERHTRRVSRSDASQVLPANSQMSGLSSVNPHQSTAIPGAGRAVFAAQNTQAAAASGVQGVNGSVLGCASSGATHGPHTTLQMPACQAGRRQVPQSSSPHAVHAQQLRHGTAGLPSHMPGYGHLGGATGGVAGANFLGQKGATVGGMGGNAGANFFSSAPAFVMVFGPNGVPQLKPLTKEQLDDGVGKYLIMEAMQTMKPPASPFAGGLHH
ncbi:putative 2OG-Fe(II) oxygenase family protein [Neospora caninum Liverpool]|uniref:2OG-Fe(II) oxygenase family protein, putative n=1 Tax=Neospora caninum (strain Liverpool) TaxID=572307 RepID=F0VC78_NEOCL|nr:putative 2OG-Fe(II) oxygenase family protein [Neospora caninum Liverpool]CBZ51212.1 putative 2OG-Fe(II) oxygenase family protein [Neospora caninum Liverpool]CEL68526.1 TPA: 2OG-Fe(II) oxygenase family protein, putative [Neospora caninum Liverpool]|eukprot:XP_003881245.1 putative 2OG-Fe(II) oxygenase family protein [Neospora caninum Liverpool]